MFNAELKLNPIKSLWKLFKNTILNTKSKKLKKSINYIASKKKKHVNKKKRKLNKLQLLQN